MQEMLEAERIGGQARLVEGLWVGVAVEWVRKAQATNRGTARWGTCHIVASAERGAVGELFSTGPGIDVGAVADEEL